LTAADGHPRVDDGLEKRRLANDHGQFLANDINFGDTQLMDWKNDNWQTIMDSFWRTIYFGDTKLETG